MPKKDHIYAQGPIPPMPDLTPEQKRIQQLGSQQQPTPVFEAPTVEPAPAAPSAEELLTKRLTDYVHHRLNQHLPSAVEFYVQELREVLTGKK